jgi:ubiquinone/menaquinone biosynthesis C-methylase UbiE
MNALSAPTRATSVTAAPDLAAVKARQRTAWSSGNYAVIGSTLQIVGETLCDTLDLHSGERVLDIAAGNGNASLAAARCWCEVTSTDYVPALLELGRRRAQADGLDIDFREADAEALPFDDASFDVVVSTFGAMFAPDAPRVAAEMLRVVRPGGRIGLANWTPQSFIGHMFKAIGRHVPPPAGVASPALWGTRERIEELFGAQAAGLTTVPRHYVFRYRSPAHMLQVFRDFYGPVHKAFGALDEAGQAALEADLLNLFGRFNRAQDGTLAAPSEYLEVVVSRR